jgi:hypothetical protein
MQAGKTAVQDAVKGAGVGFTFSIYDYVASVDCASTVIMCGSLLCVLCSFLPYLFGAEIEHGFHRV